MLVLPVRRAYCGRDSNGKNGGRFRCVQNNNGETSKSSRASAADGRSRQAGIAWRGSGRTAQSSRRQRRDYRSPRGWHQRQFALSNDGEKPMMEKNNGDIADVIHKWLAGEGLVD
jgi:hypothetical protein